jgi:CHRD domain/Concanavalin A-like lectin/glucanases superfamily
MKQSIQQLAAATALAVTAFAPATALGALRDDLVVHLPFDGNPNDNSGRGNNGTLVNTPTFAAGPLGQAVFVSNSPEAGIQGNYVTLGTVPDVLFGDSTDFSVAMWVQLNDFSGDPSFFGNKNWNSGSNLGYVLATGDDRRLQWNFKEETTGRRDYDGPGGTLPAGVWTHIAMTVKRTGKISTYLNGQLVNQTDARPAAETPASTVDTDSIPELAVNIGNDGTGQYTDGGGQVHHVNTGIDDFGLWRREVSASEISRIYSYGRGGTNIAGIPEPTGIAITAQTPTDGAVNVLPSTPIQVVIGNFSRTVNPASIRLLLNGAATTPVISNTTSNSTVTLERTALLPSGSTNTYTIIYADTAPTPTTTTNTFTFVVRTWQNITLPTPIVIETFESAAEGTLPTGWSEVNYTSGSTGLFDLNDPNSDSYLGWTTISRDRVLSASWNSERRLAVSFQVVNNQVVTQLAVNRFAYAESDNRGGSQVQYLFSPDFNLTGKTNVYLSFNSIYEQNQDSVGAVEYSIDGGTSWKPVIYYLAPGDIVRTDGAVDAVATFNAPQSDTATYTDPVTGEQAGGTYGSFIAAPITAELGAFIAPRGDDDAIDGKRVEIFRLPGADNQSRVRLRFAQAGTGSWYFGIDNVGFYSITQVAPPAITVQPASTTIVTGQSGTLTSTVTGVGVGLQWYLGTAPVLNATNSSLGLSTVTAAQAGNYVVVASNAGGSVTSSVAVVTIPAILPDLASVRTGLRTYLPFDGSYADASGNGNNASPVGAPTFTAGRLGSGSLGFTNAANGSSFNYATLGSNFLTSTQAFTVSFWAKLDAWAGDPAFIGNKNWNSGSNDGWVLATAGDGRIQWNYRSKGTPRPGRKDYDSPGGFFTGGNWRHVVVSFDPAGSASTYVDGNLIDTRDISPVGTGPDTTLALNIGQDGTGTYTDGGGVSSKGSIDEVAIWGRALSQVEAATLFQANRAGTPLLTPAPAPARVAASIANGEVTVSWTGGVAPFLLQGKSDLNGNWISLHATSASSVTLPVLGSQMYFRVVSGTTSTARLFKGALNGANERPTPVTTSATGAAIAAFDAGQVFYYLQYSGLTANTTAAHIHGPAGVNAAAGVLVGFVPAGAQAQSGVYSGTATAAPAVLEAAAAGNAYFNVHSTAFGGGEIRGQLVPVP